MSGVEERTSFGDALREALSQAQNDAGGHPESDSTDAADDDLEALADAAGDDDDSLGSEGADGSGEKGDTDADDADDSQGISAPQTWPRDRREAFDALDDDAKQLVLSIHKDMEAGLTKGQTELAEQRKRYAEVDRLIDRLSVQFPNADRQALQSSVMQSLPVLLDRYIALQANPVETLIELADELNATQALSEKLSEFSYDGEESKIRRENAALKRKLQAMQQRTVVDAESEAAAAIREFRDELTDDGVKKHPYFDEVRNVMASLMRDDDSMSMEDAYQAAVRIKKPEVDREEIAKQVRDEMLAKARKVKRQRRNGRSGPGVPPKQDEPEMSRREFLQMELQRQLSATK